MTEKDLGPEWEPSVANMMVYRQGPQVTVLVDPAHPAIWKSAPYAAQLRQWAKAEEARGGYVIVFAGDAVFKVDPAQAPA